MWRAVTLAAFALAGCSTGLFHDPVFIFVGDVQESSDPCPATSTCVEVPIEGLASAAGETGECVIYSQPGDAATMKPLIAALVEVPADVQPANGDVVAFRWEVTIPEVVDLTDAWPLCDRMIEG